MGWYVTVIFAAAVLAFLGGFFALALVGVRLFRPPVRYTVGDISIRNRAGDSVYGLARVEALADLYQRKDPGYEVYVGKGEKREWKRSDHRRVDWPPFVNFMIKRGFGKWVGM